MKNRTLGCVIALVLAVAPAFAGGIVGEWNMEMDYQGNMIPSKFIVTQGDDGALKGIWSGRRGETEVQDFQCDGTNVTFTRTVDVQGQQFDINFAGTLDGDSLNGAFESPMGALDVTGAREGATALGGFDALVGVWDAEVSSPLGDFEHQITFDDDHSGLYEGEGAEYAITEVKVEGDAVTFAMTIDMDGQELALTFEGTLAGAKLDGEFISDLGNGTVHAVKQGAGGEGVAGVVNMFIAKLGSQDIDALMVYYADDFTSDQGGGKAELKEFLAGAKDQGFLEDLEILIEDMEITEEGDKASVENIELEGAFGVLTIELELEKRDGAWLITYQAQY